MCYTIQVMVKKARSRGVSLLLELMLGLALLGVIAILALGSFATVGRSQSQSKDFSQANALARQIMETQRASGFATVNSIAPQVVVRNTEVHSSATTQTFTYQVEVSQPWTPDPVKSVVVQVEWPFSASNPGGPKRRVRLQTCVGPY